MIEKRRKGERLLEIDNVHICNCGPPPSFDATDKYVGYLENRCGEQWVFIGDRKTGKAVLRGGDVGWQREYSVSIIKPYPAHLVLSEEKKQWIITCFMAMSSVPYGVVEAAFAAGDFTDAILRMVANDQGFGE